MCIPPILRVERPWSAITPVLALLGATPHGMDTTTYLTGAQSVLGADAQGRPGTPGEAAELANNDARFRRRTVEAAGAVDAQNAPTAPWKPHTGFHELPQPLTLFKWDRGAPLRAAGPSPVTEAFGPEHEVGLFADRTRQGHFTSR